ncbi:MAG: elongation factor P [Phycisphaerae bacterium]|nr:elongation factor P [Phycisphaerae bacterium]
MLKARDIRKGRTIIHDGTLYVCHDAQHVAKGNKRSYMQTKLKDMKTGTIMEVRFSVDDRVEVPFVESKEYEFLYQDGKDYIFMDTETFDQIPIDPELIGEGTAYLIPNSKITCDIYEGSIISVNLPHTVELTVTDTPPVVKGATATNQPKEAILETGVRVRVPNFISPGERIRVDTRSGEYIERAKS